MHCIVNPAALATRPIKKGEEIQDSYSGVFSKADIGDRIRDHQGGNSILFGPIFGPLF